MSSADAPQAKPPSLTKAPPAGRKFPCSRCGAKLDFDPSSRALKCPYCGHVEQIQPDAQAAEERDFEAYLPLMPPGAVWFLDDIRWEDARVSDHANTYAGWTRIAAHSRVRRAVELDGGKFGLLQLR